MVRTIEAHIAFNNNRAERLDFIILFRLFSLRFVPKIKEINSPQPFFNIGSYVAHHGKIKYKIRTWRQLYTIEWICIWTHFNCFVYQYAVQFKLFPVLFDINICLCVRKYTTITPKRIIAHAHNNCCSRLYVCECVLAVIYNLSHESVAKCFFVWMGAFEIHIWSWWTHIYRRLFAADFCINCYQNILRRTKKVQCVFCAFTHILLNWGVKWNK